MPDEAPPVEPATHARPTAPASNAPTAAARRPRRRWVGRLDILGVIAVGGVFGTLLRAGMAQWIHVATDSFPWATFWTNLSGSFVLGFGLVLVIERMPPGRYLRPLLGTGFCGAYTTFSTFMVETALLVKHGRIGLAGSYVAGSLAAGMLAVWFGIALARWLPFGGHRGR
jgi:CrcB protein